MLDRIDALLLVVPYVYVYAFLRFLAADAVAVSAHDLGTGQAVGGDTRGGGGAVSLCLLCGDDCAVAVGGKPSGAATPDLLIDRIPYVGRSIATTTGCSLRGIACRWRVWLLVRDPKRFCRYCVSAGLLSLLRGVCIVVTGPDGARPDLHAGCLNVIRLCLRVRFGHGKPTRTAAARRTACLFDQRPVFSGHTAATCLLLLYVWPFVTLRRLMLATHIAVVASVFSRTCTTPLMSSEPMRWRLMFALREGWPQGLRLHDGAT